MTIGDGNDEFRGPTAPGPVLGRKSVRYMLGISGIGARLMAPIEPIDADGLCTDSIVMFESIDPRAGGSGFLVTDAPGIGGIRGIGGIGGILDCGKDCGKRGSNSKLDLVLSSPYPSLVAAI